MRTDVFPVTSVPPAHAEYPLFNGPPCAGWTAKLFSLSQCMFTIPQLIFAVSKNSRQRYSKAPAIYSFCRHWTTRFVLMQHN
jgi:hypothetical protein